MPSAQALLQMAARHVGERYVYGATVAKDNPNCRGPWDCAEFVSWCVYQEAGRLYGCDNNAAAPSRADAYTGYWERDARSILERISVADAGATPGAILLRYPTSTTGHIAFSEGRGSTIEAMGRRYGVTHGRVEGRSWNTGILIPGFDYGARHAPIDYHEPEGILRVGGPSVDADQVRDLQRQLERLGYHPGSMNGRYDGQTAIAVYNFQLERGLIADGEVGPQTRLALTETLDAHELAADLHADAAAGEFTIDTNLKKRISPVTADSIDAFFARQDEGKQQLKGIGPPVMDAAHKYTINATYIVAHAILETGWGRSRIYKEKNNLFGWGAEDAGPFSGAMRFENRDACIDYVMGRVNDLYLTPTGRYFETSPCLGNKSYGMNVHYASDPTWGSDIARIARRIERES
jgi:N-acetylmuramoyl-L-alanine amidase